MIKNVIKKGSAIALAAALLAGVLMLPSAHAAIAVDTTKSCSMEINVTGKDADGNDYYKELSEIPVTVKIYKVADIDVTGAYTKTEAVKDCEDLSFDDISSETTADMWQEKSEAAKKAVTDIQMEPTAEVIINEKDADGNVIDPGTVTVEGLAAGMYLVDAQQALSDYYQYDFTPYLISLPNNYYYTSGDDTWVYDLTGSNAIGLKPEKIDRYGDLVIEKELKVYNATNGGASFVFQVEAEKTDPDTNVTKKVYSNVVAMTFDGTGTQRLTIEDIPAGAEVTVTEVYSGSSYRLTSDKDVNVTIIADGEEGAPVTASFANTYEDGHDGGNGAVNTFTYTPGEEGTKGSWTHSATGVVTEEE